MGFAIETADPYLDRETGERGFAILDRSGNVAVNSMQDWIDVLTESCDKDGLKKLLPLYDELSAWWRLPGRPNLDEEDEDLQRDLIRFLAEHIWFADRRTYELVANWIISTWIQDELGVATRLNLLGPTHSGKSRLINCIQILSRRAFTGIMPTGPSIYRLIESYGLTICIDELEDLGKETLVDVMMIYKGGFEPGASVPRTNDQGKVVAFKTYAPMVIGKKGGGLKEDIENRAITIHMLQKPSDSELKDQPIRRRIDEDTAYELRTRLFSFRLRIQRIEADGCDKGILQLIEKALSIAVDPVMIEAGEVLLNDRSIQIAGQLLVPGLIFKDYSDTLELIAESQNSAVQSLNETTAAKVFMALQAVMEMEKRSMHFISGELDVSRISVTDVADQYNQDLIDQGNEGKDKVKTRYVGDALRGLGFETRTGKGHGNKSYFDPKGFDEKYRIYLSKFGAREPISARPNHALTSN